MDSEKMDNAPTAKPTKTYHGTGNLVKSLVKIVSASSTMWRGTEVPLSASAQTVEVNNLDVLFDIGGNVFVWQL